MMYDQANPTDRRPGEFLLFAGAFLGFVTAAAGILVTMPFLALCGVGLMLLAASSFALMAED
jgi:hypothetical protein